MHRGAFQGYHNEEKRYPCFWQLFNTSYFNGLHFNEIITSFECCGGTSLPEDCPSSPEIEDEQGSVNLLGVPELRTKDNKEENLKGIKRCKLSKFEEMALKRANQRHKMSMTQPQVIHYHSLRASDIEALGAFWRIAFGKENRQKKGIRCETPTASDLCHIKYS